VPLLSTKFLMDSLITGTRPYQSNAFDFAVPSIIHSKKLPALHMVILQKLRGM